MGVNVVRREKDGLHRLRELRRGESERYRLKRPTIVQSMGLHAYVGSRPSLKKTSDLTWRKALTVPVTS